MVTHAKGVECLCERRHLMVLGATRNTLCRRWLACARRDGPVFAFGGETALEQTEVVSSGFDRTKLGQGTK